MAQLIKHGIATTDSWHILELAEGEAPETVTLPDGDVIFPLAVWQARKDEIVSRPTIGLLLQPADRVEDVAGELASFNLIAVNFPKFVDGRGYSTAALLRQRYGYTGELRAVGDVLHDQLFFMRRVGFDSYALKAVARHDAVDLCFGAAIHHHHGIELAHPAARLHQQGNIEDDGATPCGCGISCLLIAQACHPGVNDGFKLRARQGVGKSQGAHAGAVHGARGINGVLPEGSPNVGYGSAPSQGDTAGNRVCIDQRCATGLQHLPQRALAAANAPGQAHMHWPLHHYRPNRFSTVCKMALGPNTMAVRPAPTRNGPNGT